MKTNRRKNQLAETVETPTRFRHTISKYIIRRNSRCISCGLCAELCPYGVHPRYENYSKPLRPQSHKCIGFSCKENDFYCIDRCPEQALTLGLNPILETLGDYRWTAEMLIGHWEMAETGDLPVVDLEYDLGNSGGGFDKIRFKLPDPKDYLDISDEEIDTSVKLNKRNDGRLEKSISIRQST
jgi:ferredoxin